MMANGNKLDAAQRSALTTALSVAAEKFDEDAKVLADIAAHLRDGGKSYPMFAEGEIGARAADQLGQQCERRAEASRTLRDLLEGAPEILLLAAEEEEEGL